MYLVRKQGGPNKNIFNNSESKGEFALRTTVCFLFWNTYIIGHYNPSVWIIDLVSHTTYVVCVNFIHKWRDLQFKVDSERHIIWETFHGNFYWLSEFLPEICWEEIAEEILFVFHFFLCLAWDSNPGFSSNKPTHYLLENGDFFSFEIQKKKKNWT